MSHGVHRGRGRLPEAAAAGEDRRRLPGWAVGYSPLVTGAALAHGYDMAFWWTAGILADDAVIAGALLRPGPLDQQGTPSQAHDGVPTVQAKAAPPIRQDPAVPDGSLRSRESP